MPSSRRTNNPRRKMFLNLSGQIEGQLREAYDRKFKAGLATQSSLAAKLDVDRSAIHHRLKGHTNMTVETIADMVWALDQAIKIEIYDPTAIHGLNYFISPMQAQAFELSKSSNELPRTTPEKVPQPNAPLVMVMGD